MNKKIIRPIRQITAKFSKDNLAAYSAQSAFFLFISVFPVIILVSTLIRYTPLSKNMLITIINDVIPGVIGDTLINWTNEIYSGASGFISFSIVFVLWSASKSFMGIIDSLDNIYNPEKRYPRIVNRLRAIICTILFMAVVLIAGITVIFANKLVSLLKEFIPDLPDILLTIIESRTIFALAAFLLIVMFMYKFLPRMKIRFKDALPGALFTTLIWFVFSYLYSFYIDNISSAASIYGSITTIILLMLWLYFCMYIFLIGAEINHYFMKNND